jgi:hypothetical protein
MRNALLSWLKIVSLPNNGQKTHGDKRSGTNDVADRANEYAEWHVASVVLLAEKYVHY